MSQAPRSVRYGEGREALLAATTRVVAERGLRNVTYRAVAEEAGVAHALVRHHFGSRDALVAEAVRYAVDRSVAASALEPGTGSVDDFASGLFDLATQDPESQAFQYELMLESRRRPEIRPLLERVYEHYRQAARDGLARLGVNDPALGDLVFATLDGLVFQQVTFGDRRHTEAVTQRLRLLLRTQLPT